LRKAEAGAINWVQENIVRRRKASWGRQLRGKKAVEEGVDEKSRFEREGLAP